MYDKYKRLVYKIAFTYLNNIYDAEDIVQDVFVSYYKSHVEFTNESHEKNWFIRITVNLCINYRKSFWKRNVDKTDELEASCDLNTENIEIKDLYQL